MHSIKSLISPKLYDAGSVCDTSYELNLKLRKSSFGFLKDSLDFSLNDLLELFDESAIRGLLSSLILTLLCSILPNLRKLGRSTTIPCEKLLVELATT